MGLRSRRGAARAGSNLGHFPEQFEPNSTTLYIIRPPAHSAARAPRVVLLARTPPPALSLARSNLALSACDAGRRAQSAGRTCANKIDFLSALLWRFVTSLFTSPPAERGHEIFDGPSWRDTTLYRLEFMMFSFTYQFIAIPFYNCCRIDCRIWIA